MDEEKYYDMIELYKHPEHFGKPEDFDVEHEEYSSSCGDVFKVYLKMDGDIVKDASFEGSGCVISTISISKLCGEITGKKIHDILSMNLDDIKRIISVDAINSSRVKCATIGLETVKAALSKR